jgi:tryptophan-rich sensory protein
MADTATAHDSIAKRGLALTISVIACFTAAGLGTIATSRSLQTWYAALAKPSWNPPNWIFGPVWSTLYTMMAISAWLVWKNRHAGPAQARTALLWFTAQLLLNTGWSWLFFGFRQPGAAFVEVIVLWIAIAMTIFTSARLSVTAAVLLVPYLLWVTFASTLNGVIWRLNA